MRRSIKRARRRAAYLKRTARKRLTVITRETLSELVPGFKQELVDAVMKYGGTTGKEN